MEGEGARLVALLREAIDQGLRGPGDLIAGAPGLIDIIAPHSSDQIAGADRAHSIIRASMQALDSDARTALRALYGLDRPRPKPPAPPDRQGQRKSTPRRTVLLTATQRRAAAGRVIQRSGITWQRAYETIYLTDLAAEILRRVRTGDDTTHGRPRGWMPYEPPPPPPAASFQPRAPERNRGTSTPDTGKPEA
ncbi:conserved hypothetical protein [Frankia canadensis]|uniref:Uncharacterized protein n=2 Tax=Frankia canadensis TaxID=1836972 RepID=A0A2I2KR47_9ACTN|nr:conserved hypothetical protein [Frankia canadensis]SOU55410.1 conserved hypothetical protein [Frankia canadensis]